MTVSALTVVLVAIVVAVIVLSGLWGFATANRLDRLHVRTDSAWQALDAALARRAVVVRALAADLPESEAAHLVDLSLRAERVDRDGRERAENALSRALSAVDPATVRASHATEMADADARVLIARRFHNDAARDTRALQGRRLVRWLRLGGTASMPPFFDISEGTLRSGATGTPDAAGPLDAVGPAQPRVPDGGEDRKSARVVILDDSAEQARVLLVRGHDPSGSGEPFWFTFGGGVEPGETLRAAAVRELREETGLEVGQDALCGPVWRRLSLFPWGGRMLHSVECFFVLRTAAFDPCPDGRTDIERDALEGHRWFTAEELGRLAGSGATLYPQDLASLVPDALDCLADGGAREVRTIR